MNIVILSWDFLQTIKIILKLQLPWDYIMFFKVVGMECKMLMGFISVIKNNASLAEYEKTFALSSLVLL